MANMTLDDIGTTPRGASVGLPEPGDHPTPALATRVRSKSQTPHDEVRPAMSSLQQVAPSPQQHEDQVKTSNAPAVAGFVLALLGALTSFLPIVNVLGDLLAFLGLAFGVIGLNKARRRGTGTGLSTAAIILTVAAFVISAVINVAVVVALNSPPNVGVAHNVTSYRSP